MKSGTSPCIFISTSAGQQAVGKYFRALAASLAERGAQVVMVFDGVRRELIDARGNPAVYTWPSVRPVRLRDGLFLAGLVRRYRPHCLVGNFSALNWNMLVGCLLRVRVRVAWYHTLSRQLELDTNRSKVFLAWQHLRKKHIYRLATHLVCNSSATRADLVSRYGEREGRISVFPLLMDDLETSETLGGKGRDYNLVLCVGRLFPSKGQEVLLRALPRVLEVFPQTRLEFLGDGPDWERLQRLAGELGVTGACVFQGTVSLEQVLRRMRVATVTVSPSRSEAFGLVNVESLAVGTPVIGADVDGIRGIVRDGVDGFLVDPMDPEAWTHRLLEVLGNRGLHESLSRAARRRFLDVYCLDSNLNKHTDWYLEQIAEAGGPSLKNFRIQ